ncbi:MAG: hypothetical protein L0H36_02665 [bacterium]|nr:hypothetical protein [bacterium]MDN5835515.1 hypothetical protein [bacterium]
MIEKYKLLYDHEQVQQRIGQLASEITAHYDGGDERPLFVSLLRGAVPFTSHLMTEIARQAPDFHPEVDYMTTSRYSDRAIAKEKAEIVMGLSPDTEVENRPTVIIDDVLDMGETAETVRKYLYDLGALSVKLAVLVNKDVPNRSSSVEADFVGFDNAPNQWLVGMGMDDSAHKKEARRWDSQIWTIEPGQDTHDRILEPAE